MFPFLKGEKQRERTRSNRISFHSSLNVFLLGARECHLKMAPVELESSGGPQHHPISILRPDQIPNFTDRHPDSKPPDSSQNLWAEGGGMGAGRQVGGGVGLQVRRSQWHGGQVDSGSDPNDSGWPALESRNFRKIHPPTSRLDHSSLPGCSRSWGPHHLSLQLEHHPRSPSSLTLRVTSHPLGFVFTQTERQSPPSGASLPLHHHSQLLQSPH